MKLTTLPVSRKVRGKLEFEPDVDPPPDLILEVDVTSDSLEQLALYAAMGIPEVWIYDGKRLAVPDSESQRQV